MRYLSPLVIFLLIAAACCSLCIQPELPAQPGSGNTSGPSVSFDPASVPVRNATIGDTGIAYKKFGSGPPMVMIMGYAGTMDMWPPALLQRLSEEYTVIIFDNRGMGLSTSSPREYSIPLFAQDTVGLMQALNISRAHAFAWSMGTDIAQEIAIEYPENVDGLILYAADSGGKEAISPSPEVIGILANTSGTEQERGTRLVSLLFPGSWFQTHSDFYSYFPRVTESSPPANIERQALAIEHWNGSYSRLPQIKANTLLVTGTEDVITPPENSFIIGRQIPGAWVVQFRDAGHGLMYQYPQELADTVIFFLDSR
jgi:pimeloyl-ACP methyl ester carboxylesterase